MHPPHHPNHPTRHCHARGEHSPDEAQVAGTPGRVGPRRGDQQDYRDAPRRRRPLPPHGATAGGPHPL